MVTGDSSGSKEAYLGAWGKVLAVDEVEACRKRFAMLKEAKTLLAVCVQCVGPASERRGLD